MPNGPARRQRKRGRKKRQNDGETKESANGTNEDAAAATKPAAQEGNPPNQSAPRKNKPRRNRNRKPKADTATPTGSTKPRQPRKKYPWRRHIPPGSLDPITLENLISLPYPPFALAATKPYVRVPVWPVPETTNTDSNEQQQQEKMSPEEWQRRVIEEQWGQAAVLPKEQQQEDEEEDIGPQKQHYNLFDGRALAYYLVSQLQFIDPFNRRDLTRDELVNLDEYLKRHGFNDLKVTEAYDAKGVTVSRAGALGNTAEGRAAILQQEAQVLLNNMFAGSNQLQQQYAASQRQRRPTNNTRRNHRQEREDTGIYGTDDGAFVVIDDDANPGLRGRGVRNASVPMEISVAPNTLWSSNRVTQNLNHSARAQAQNFPALPTPAAPATDSGSSTPNERESVKGPSKSLQKITKVVAPTDPAQIKRQKEAREEAQRRAMMANLNFIAPGTEVNLNTATVDGLVQVPAAATTGPTSGQILRNQAMASALGVMPATMRQHVNAGWARPTDVKLELDEFGNELNAAQYPDYLIQEARERMGQLLKLERRWKTFLADDKSASLPLNPMDRPLRTFVHHYSDFWNLHTESFDGEPKRYINCVKLRETRVPVPLLSDVARKWRGPAPVVLPRGPRESTSQDVQTAGQPTASREFPPAPPREPLKLKPRSVPPEEVIVLSDSEAGEVAAKADEEAQLNSRFDSLFTGRERPKLELAARTVPLELPPYQPAKAYDVMAERERQRAERAAKARKEREEAERKARLLAYAFASSDEESLASAGGSSEWEEAEEQYSGSDEASK